MEQGYYASTRLSEEWMIGRNSDKAHYLIY